TSMDGIKEVTTEVTTPDGIKTVKEVKIQSLWIYEGVVNHYRGSEKDPAAYPGMDLPTMTSATHTHLIAMGLL
ncbi:MAG: hypothetical protein AAB019_04525, partial [Planctomycetota bacterium]